MLLLLLRRHRRFRWCVEERRPFGAAAAGVPLHAAIERVLLLLLRWRWPNDVHHSRTHEERNARRAEGERRRLAAESVSNRKGEQRKRRSDNGARREQQGGSVLDAIGRRDRRS